MSEKKVCPFCGSDKIENHRYNTDDKGFIWYDHFVCLTCGKEGFEPSDRKRKTTEDIVPPFELCKQIPAGHFADSVLVWSYSCDKRKTEPFVEERDCIDFCRRDIINAPPVYPAPTLQEIFFSIEKDHRCYLPNVYCTPENVLKLWLDQENRIKAKGEPEA